MSHSLEFLIHYGYLLIFGWVFVEQIGIPLPSIPVLLAAGALCGMHRMNSAAAMAVAIVAAVCADLICSSEILQRHPCAAIPLQNFTGTGFLRTPH